MAQKANNWFVDTDDESDFLILHYIGGESPYYIYDEYKDEETAQRIADELNDSNIEYGFNCHEDNCALWFKNLPNPETFRKELP